jgi:hypothetical protein
LFTHIFSAFVLLWELQIGYLSEVTPQDWLKTTECVQSLRRKFTDLFRGDQCFRHFLCDKCVDLSCPLGLVTHALSVSRGTNLGQTQKNLRRFSKNVGDFPKNVGDFFKNVGDFFEGSSRVAFCSS